MLHINHSHSPEMVQLLADSPICHGLTSAELQTVLNAANYVQIEQGAHFFYQNEAAVRFYLLHDGQVRLTQINPDGRQVIIHFVNEGEPMAVVVAIGYTSYPVSAEAVTDCTALGWDRDTFSDLMDQIPRLGVNSLRMIAPRFVELQNRYLELATERVEQRIAHALVRQAQEQQTRIPQANETPHIVLSRQDIADMTGATMHTVSRTCSAWEQQGFIETRRGHITLHNLDALIAIADA
jgi:CRP-like cAMP-binding protein